MAVVSKEGFPDKNILEKRIEKIVTIVMIMIIITMIIYSKNSNTTTNNKKIIKIERSIEKQSGYNVDEREKFLKAF